jgi:hypothetical protein
MVVRVGTEASIVMETFGGDGGDRGWRCALWDEFSFPLPHPPPTAHSYHPNPGDVLYWLSSPSGGDGGSDGDGGDGGDRVTIMMLGDFDHHDSSTTCSTT